jgi:hypothetical protein
MSIKWDIKLNLTSLLILLTIIVGLLFGVRALRSKNSEITRLNQNNAILESEFKNYRDQSTGRIISYKQSLELYQSELKAALESDSINRELARHYKKLSEHVQIKTEFVHDTIEIEAPILVGENNDTSFNYSDECFKVNLSVSDGLLSLNSVDVFNQQDIVTGLRKNGLARSYWAVDVHNSNPCIHVVGVNSAHVVTRKKWWENPLITGTIGIAIGVIGWEYVR